MVLIRLWAAGPGLYGWSGARLYPVLVRQREPLPPLAGGAAVQPAGGGGLPAGPGPGAPGAQKAPPRHGRHSGGDHLLRLCGEPRGAGLLHLHPQGPGKRHPRLPGAVRGAGGTGHRRQ